MPHSQTPQAPTPLGATPFNLLAGAISTLAMCDCGHYEIEGEEYVDDDRYTTCQRCHQKALANEDSCYED